MKKILVVGQTPPPYGGQAIMIQKMLEATMPGVEFIHARMNFSSDMEEIGKFRFTKIFKLFKLILTIYYLRLRYNVTNLYYPPSPPRRVPMLRDVIILISCRWLFRNTIFHFHAAGISEMHQELRGIFRLAFERAYFDPEYSITLSEFNPRDGEYLRSKRDVLIPNGLDDLASGTAKAASNLFPVLLYVGLLTESKGVLILLATAARLKDQGYNFSVVLVGRFESQEFETVVRSYMLANDLMDRIRLTGVLVGDQKAAAYASADIFCFPTYFEAETFGLVALEAMQFGLPVVATSWRGVPSIVRNGINGFTVTPHDVDSFAEKIEVLLNDSALRREMGSKGREIYQSGYTGDIYSRNLCELFTAI